MGWFLQVQSAQVRKGLSERRIEVISEDIIIRDDAQLLCDIHRRERSGSIKQPNIQVVSARLTSNGFE